MMGLCLSIIRAIAHGTLPADEVHHHRSLLLLPVEVVEEIICQIDSLTDLSSLSQTCKALHSLVVPDHLQWFSILTSTAYPEIFEKFLVQRRLAGHVKRLMIIDHEPRTTLGYAIHKAGPYSRSSECPSILKSASNLTRLQRLDLSINDLGSLKDLFRTLRASGCWLQRVGIQCRQSVSGDISPELEVLNEIDSLRAFEWTSYFFETNELLGHILHMLNTRCPDLEMLLLEWSPRTRDAIPHPGLWMCRWPSLKALRVNATNMSGDVGDFLNSHLSLETLMLSSMHLTSFISEDALPKLREVFLGLQNTQHLFSLTRPLPCGQYRPLQLLSYVRIQGSRYEDIKLFCSHLSKINSLERLYWHENGSSRLLGLTRLSHYHPKLTYLHLSVRGASLDRVGLLLSSFTKLEEVQVASVGTDIQWKIFFESVGKACPNLRRVGEWSRGLDGVWNRVSSDSVKKTYTTTFEAHG